MSDLTDPNQTQKMIDECESAMTAKNHGFSAWELEFLESVIDQWESRKSLSPKQVTILENCWDKS